MILELKTNFYFGVESIAEFTNHIQNWTFLQKISKTLVVPSLV